MKPEPVYLHLCDSDEVRIVTEGWWRRFLISQAKALGVAKKELTRSTGTGVDSEVRGTGTDGILQGQEAASGRRHAVQV